MGGCGTANQSPCVDSPISVPKCGVGSGAEDLIGGSHKCHMKRSKHPERLPASLAFLNTRDLQAGGGEVVIPATFTSRRALYTRRIRTAQSRISGLLAANRAQGAQARPEAPKAG